MDTIFRVWSDSFEDGKPIPEGLTRLSEQSR